MPWLLLLALPLVWVPLSPGLLGALFGLLLIAQVTAAAYALLTDPLLDRRGWSGHVQRVERLQDAVLLLAMVLAAACHREGNPWPVADELGLVGLALGLAGNALYLKAMVHHQRAHEQMEREFEERLVGQHTAVDADVQVGILTPEEGQAKHALLDARRPEVAAICTLGRRAGGYAVLQLACLAVALGADPGGGVFVTWLVAVVLPGWLNSKAQDLLLYPYVPPESRLC